MQVQLHVTSASEKVGGIIPSPKSGGPIPLTPPAPTPMMSSVTVHRVQYYTTGYCLSPAGWLQHRQNVCAVMGH